MGKRFVVLLSVIMCLTNVRAQNNTFTFKVRNPRSEVVVQHRDSVLYTDHNNVLKIKVTGKNKLGPVHLQGGKLRRYRSSFLATVEEGLQAVLTVYVIKPNGELELGLSKIYPIVQLSDPVPHFGGVKSDSIIHRDDLLAKGTMYAKLTRFGGTAILPVVSYDMLIINDGRVDTLSVNGGKLTIEMRRHIQTLRPGNPLSFMKIKCRMEDGEIRELGDMRLFVDCTPRYDVLRYNR